MNTNELIIECHVRGQPHPKIAWVKDGQRIGTHDKYQQFDHDDGKCELIINHPTPNDSGKYICCAENYLKNEEIGHWVQYDGKEMHIIENIHGAYHVDHHKAKDNKNKADAEDDKKKDKKKGKAAKAEAASASTTSTTVTIEKKPKPATFANMLKDRVIAEGAAMTISCYVNGTEPMVKWQKDGNIIDFGSRLKNKTAEGHALLEFTSVVVEDSGEYKCIARNALGEVSTSMILTVYRTNKSADSPPTFTRALKDTYNAMIKEHYIECHVRGVPTPKVTWVRDGSAIENCEKYHQIEHENGKCELVINNPTPMDSGKYICVAENRAKKVEISHCIVVEATTAAHKKIVYDDPEPEPEPEPEIVEEIPVAAPEETPIVEAEPAKPDKTSKSSKGKPKAKEAAAAQGGRPGSKPLPDPKTKLCFLAGLTNRTAPVGGKNVKMQAYVQGPEPQCKWFKNDAPVVFGPRIRQTNKDGLVAIEFLDPSIEDCGDYKCVARNPSGEVSTTASLTIYEISMTDSSPPTFVRAITGMFCYCSLIFSVSFCFHFNYTLRSSYRR